MEKKLHYSSVIKSNKVYPISPKITITVRMINNHIFQKEYGSPTIILPDIFVAAELYSRKVGSLEKHVW